MLTNLWPFVSEWIWFQNESQQRGCCLELGPGLRGGITQWLALPCVTWGWGPAGKWPPSCHHSFSLANQELCRDRHHPASPSGWLAARSRKEDVAACFQQRERWSNWIGVCRLVPGAAWARVVHFVADWFRNEMPIPTQYLYPHQCTKIK